MDVHADLWRFPDEHFVRTHGWRISRRPKRGPDMWAKDGLELTLPEAILWVCGWEVHVWEEERPVEWVNAAGIVMTTDQAIQNVGSTCSAPRPCAGT